MHEMVSYHVFTLCMFKCTPSVAVVKENNGLCLYYLFSLTSDMYRESCSSSWFCMAEPLDLDKLPRF